MSWRLSAVGTLIVLVFLGSPAWAQGDAAASDQNVSRNTPDVGGGYNAALASSREVVVGTWNWYKLTRTYTYFSGAAWYIWCDSRTSFDTFYIEATHPLADQLRSAIAGDRWLGLFWVTANVWTEAQVFYY
jgi:hypothetical protein